KFYSCRRGVKRRVSTNNLSCQGVASVAFEHLFGDSPDTLQGHCPCMNGDDATCSHCKLKYPPGRRVVASPGTSDFNVVDETHTQQKFSKGRSQTTKMKSERRGEAGYEGVWGVFYAGFGHLLGTAWAKTEGHLKLSQKK
ncbi:tRNA-2-methylthio-N(6)-dimethylallyladenosine synthase, partial [Dissostichus eleginoides]